MLNKSEINFKVKEIRTIKSPSGKDIPSTSSIFLSP